MYGDQLLLYWATRDPAMEIQMQGVSAAPLESDLGLRQLDSAESAGTHSRAASADGADPPDMDLAWEGKCIEAAAMALHNGRLYMFYAGNYNNQPQQVGVAVSEDGVRFRRLSANPFLPNGAPGTWNHRESGHPFLFQDEGQDYLFYQGNAKQGTWYLSVVPINWQNERPIINLSKLWQGK